MGGKKKSIQKGKEEKKQNKQNKQKAQNKMVEIDSNK